MSDLEVDDISNDQLAHERQLKFYEMEQRMISLESLVEKNQNVDMDEMAEDIARKIDRRPKQLIPHIMAMFQPIRVIGTRLDNLESRFDEVNKN